MQISPEEIKNHHFKKVLRGYDPRDVDEFLRTIANDYEDVYDENDEMKIRIREMIAKIEQYQQLETTLQQTLVQAQEFANKSVSNSKTFEEQSRKDAEKTSAKIVEQAYRDLVKMKEEIDILETKRDNLLGRMKELLMTELRILQQEEEKATKKMNAAEMESQNTSTEFEEIIVAITK
jgi:cell division initiation protein